MPKYAGKHYAYTAAGKKKLAADKNRDAEKNKKKTVKKKTSRKRRA